MTLHRPKQTARRSPTPIKESLHPRNKNNGRYDFPALIAQYPILAPHVFTNRFGDVSIDFASPQAVRCLNSVLLEHHYGIRYWQFPEDHLCPPIPGRADYVHYLDDLLTASNNGQPVPGRDVTVLDIGTGATCIYPLIGRSEYGWRFVGAETERSSVDSCLSILSANAIPDSEIDIRLQTDRKQFFRGIIRNEERFDVTMCNPPFHSSYAQAASGTQRKWKNLGKTEDPELNFGGKDHELVYPGGEIAFASGLAEESVPFGSQVLWFTTLLSRQTAVPLLRSKLESLGVTDIRVIEMAQGQKRSRFVAWTFHSPDSAARWKSMRWKNG
jgi:23S rRNA (adenine1618-N6)-methyltransferase